MAAPREEGRGGKGKGKGEQPSTTGRVPQIPHEAERREGMLPEGEEGGQSYGREGGEPVADSVDSVMAIWVV